MNFINRVGRESIVAPSFQSNRALSTTLDSPEAELDIRVSQKELENIKAFQLPDFKPPYPYLTNPHAEKAKAESFRWVESFSLLDVYKTPKEVEKFYKTDFGRLPMCAYVDCDEKMATWVCNLFQWLFLIDDHFDTINNFRSPEKLTSFFVEINLVFMWSFPDSKQFYEKFEEFLVEEDNAGRTRALSYVKSKLDEARLNPGTVYDTSSPHIHQLCKSLRALWAPVYEAMPVDFVHRWSLLFQHHIMGVFRELINRKRKEIPAVEECIEIRRDSIAMWVCMPIIEFIDNVHLPDEVFYLPEMRRFLLGANDIVTWHNDLWSFEKEAMIGDVHNLVIAVSHEQNCSYAEAGKRVYRMVLDKITEMEQAIEDLQKVTPDEYQYAVSRYVHLARTSVTGTHVWHDNCVRYSLKKAWTTKAVSCAMI